LKEKQTVFAAWFAMIIVSSLPEIIHGYGVGFPWRTLTYRKWWYGHLNIILDRLHWPPW